MTDQRSEPDDGSVEVDIDADIVDAARDAATRSGRSVDEQVEFWVRLGREVERTGDRDGS